ncbi:MAG: GNAT family N-acetyltransferase [Eubacteriales bacterium]|nr:GNAT family N-acetyltransferase [Eubacteriales bacterium]
MIYTIEIPSPGEEEEIDDELMAYNLQQVPPAQEEPFIKICRCAKDENGVLLGGILACSVLWNVLYVETVWVREDCRGMHIASALLNAVEEEARKCGCYVAQLDTFDFQARAFYEKCGYQVFGTLEDVPEGHARYYMWKRLDS